VTELPRPEDAGGPELDVDLDGLEDLGVVDPAADMGMTAEEYADAVASHGYPEGASGPKLDSHPNGRESGGGADWWDVPPAGPPLAGPDPGPAPVGKGKGHRDGAGPPRVTAAVRRDVNAKIRFIAVPVCRLWEIRDPVCGGAAVQAEPNASAAFTDIVLQSPDLIAWFTGPAAGFMVYLNLFMAVLPVLQVVYAHHVSHGIKDAEDYANARGAAVDRDQYAA
jgi:hypothetical protein